MNIAIAIKHFALIVHHKYDVLKSCFRVGLYRQGITHDLSKFSYTEFLLGVKYYSGGKYSPSRKERNENGFSYIWMHHKGRNKHHYEYWTDVSKDGSLRLQFQKMPFKYVVEMAFDRISASKIYGRANYTNKDAFLYLLNGTEKNNMNEENYRELKKILSILAENGEEIMYEYIKSTLHNNNE